MTKRTIAIFFFLLLLGVSLYAVFSLEDGITPEGELINAERELQRFQLIIWLCWVVLIVGSVIYKWITQRNLLFYLTYAFIFISFVIFGIYFQRVVTLYNLPSAFGDNYTLGIFTALQNILVCGILTGALQAAVWWFTKKRTHH